MYERGKRGVRVHVYPLRSALHSLHDHFSRSEPCMTCHHDEQLAIPARVVRRLPFFFVDGKGLGGMLQLLLRKEGPVAACSSPLTPEQTCHTLPTLKLPASCTRGRSKRDRMEMCVLNEIKARSTSKCCAIVHLQRDPQRERFESTRSLRVTLRETGTKTCSELLCHRCFFIPQLILQPPPRHTYTYTF